MEVCKNNEENTQTIEETFESKTLISVVPNPTAEMEVKPTTCQQQTRTSARVFKKLKLDKDDLIQATNTEDSPNLTEHDTVQTVFVDPKEPNKSQQTTRSSGRVTKKMKLEQQEDNKDMIPPDQNNISCEDAAQLHNSTCSEQVLLGSLTTTSSNTEGEGSKSQQIRSSARVVKKLKLDLLSSPVVEKKIEKKEEVKTDIKKNFRPLWTSDDKNMFFEAINEYGKDFENVHLYMSTKLKKKGVPEHLIKTKDQIRHFYNRTWHEVSKHVRFSDGVKKVVQELYGIINYGKLRKKVGSVREKSCMKLSELIYCGSMVLRVKGKTIRVKTPLCRALRKINQLDDKYDEIKLPNRVTVELRPKDMTSFLRVQTMAQNPRLCTILPLQKRLSSLIACVSKRWKSFDAIMYDKALISSNTITTQCVPSVKESEEKKELFTRVLRLCPPFDSKIELPSINLSEYLTRQSICLNAYEDRLGIKSPNDYKFPRQKSSSKKGSSSKCHEKVASVIPQVNVIAEEKVVKEEIKEEVRDWTEIESDTTLLNVVDDAVNTILSLQQEVNKDQSIEDTLEEVISVSRDTEKKDNAEPEVLDQEKLDKIKNIRRGWTELESDSLTIGEVYLMCGSDSKLILEYSWDDFNEGDRIKIEKESAGQFFSDWSATTDTIFPPSETQPDATATQDKKSLDLSYSLSQLLSVAKLHYGKNIVQCPCGHVCNLQQQSTDSKIRKMLTDNKGAECNVISSEPQDRIKLEEIALPEDNISGTTTGHVNKPSSKDTATLSDSGLTEFRSPYTVQQQLNSIRRLKPKYCNRKGRRPRSKRVVVERKLPLLPNKVESGHQIVRMNIISQQRTTETENQKNNPHVVTTNNDVVAVPVIFLTQNPVLPTATNSSKCQSIPLSTEDSNTLPTVPNSPSRLLKEGENQWINAEVADYSLSSLLGHLESPMKGSGSNLGHSEYTRLSQDVDAQLHSLLTESSVDFAAKFADLAAEVVYEVKQE